MADKILGYVRVSLDKQVEGNSLEGQKQMIENFAKTHGYELEKIYRDEGKSGKSIEGRKGFQKMLRDLEVMQDVKYVVCFKLSRFGRNVTDILNSLEYIRRYGVELQTIDDNIDTGAPMGKILVTVLGAVAEIERENIIAQTMLGRTIVTEKGGWNGGFAPYGYKLRENHKKEEGCFDVVPTQAEHVRTIFKMFVEDQMGYTTIAHTLNAKGIEREHTKNSGHRKFDDWTSHQVKTILDNPLYTGKIAYGRRKSEKVRGTKNQTRMKKQDSYIESEIVNEPIISEETFEKAKARRKVTGVKGNPRIGREMKHLLSGILKCPDCGGSMVSDKNMWTNKDGTEMVRYSYTCQHYRISGKGGSCRRNGVPAHVVEAEVLDYTKKLLDNKEFAGEIKKRIGNTIDLSEIDKLIKELTKKLAMQNKKINLAEKELDNIIDDDKHAKRKRDSLNERIDTYYDELERIETELNKERSKRAIAKKDTLTVEVIYNMLMSFDTIYDKLDDKEQRTLIESMIQEVHLYTQEERQQLDTKKYVKEIIYSFPVSDRVLHSFTHENATVETVVLLSKG